MSELTKVDPNFFKEMKTDQGITVDELCQKGVKVLLYFLYSLGRPFCQGRIDDLFNMYESITKLGVVPIVLYNEDTEDYKDFVQKNRKSDNYDVFLSMKQNEFNKIFKIQSFSKFSALSINFFSRLFRLLQSGITKNTEYVEKVPQQLATAFIVYQNKIISEYRPKTLDEPFDWTNIVVDPDNFEISVKESSPLTCDYVPKRKRIENKPKFEKKKEEKFIKENNGHNSLKNESDTEIGLKDVLKYDQYRKYFKIHLLKEFSVENLLFWEKFNIIRA